MGFVYFSGYQNESCNLPTLRSHQLFLPFNHQSQTIRWRDPSRGCYDKKLFLCKLLKWNQHAVIFHSQLTKNNYANVQKCLPIGTSVIFFRLRNASLVLLTVTHHWGSCFGPATLNDLSPISSNAIRRFLNCKNAFLLCLAHSKDSIENKVLNAQYFIWLSQITETNFYNTSRITDH